MIALRSEPTLFLPGAAFEVRNNRNPPVWSRSEGANSCHPFVIINFRIPQPRCEFGFGSTCLIWLCSDESARPQVAAAINVVVLRVRATSGQPNLVRDKCRGGGVGLPVQPRLPTNEVPQFMARVDYRQAA